MSSKRKIFSISEASILYFLLLAFLGKNPMVLQVSPLLPPLGRALRGIIQQLHRHGLIHMAEDICSDIPKSGSLLHYYDIFGKTENWHNKHFGYDAIPADHSYAMAYKHVTGNYVVSRYWGVLTLRRLLEEGPADVIGLDPDSAALYEQLFGDTVSTNPHGVIRQMLNILITLAVYAATLSQIITKLRFRVRAKEIFFAADFLGDVRDTRLYAEIAEGGPVLLVVRIPAFNDRITDDLRHHYGVCQASDGVIPLSSLGAVTLEAARHCLDIHRRFSGCANAHYWSVVAMVPKRMRYRAFFNKFHPRFFYGRDDYNVEHVLRRQELHRVKGKSLGINHSIPNVAIVQPMWRYISFDYYYVFGRWLYESHYKSTWANDMTVRDVGSFGFSREQYEQFKQPKPKDVAIFTDNSAGNPRVLEIVRHLAAQLPDRKILLQVRNGRREINRNFIAACQADLDNVEYQPVGAYELFTRAQYAVSDASAVIPEAIQAGVTIFFMDVMPIHPSCLFRAFPDLTVIDGPEIVARIRGIEAGTWHYPREVYSGLVNFSGRTFFDVVRTDVGLEPLS